MDVNNDSVVDEQELSETIGKVLQQFKQANKVDESCMNIIPTLYTSTKSTVVASFNFILMKSVLLSEEMVKCCSINCPL